MVVGRSQQHDVASIPWLFPDGRYTATVSRVELSLIESLSLSSILFNSPLFNLSSVSQSLFSKVYLVRPLIIMVVRSDR